jgi:hypothetical protein
MLDAMNREAEIKTELRLLYLRKVALDEEKMQHDRQWRDETKAINKAVAALERRIKLKVVGDGSE